MRVLASTDFVKARTWVRRAAFDDIDRGEDGRIRLRRKRRRRREGEIVTVTVEKWRGEGRWEYSGCEVKGEEK